MPLPKALLCILDDDPSDPPHEELRLRSVGFAAATASWREVAAVRGGWMQLLPILDDPAVQAWVFRGRAQDFTTDVLRRWGMLVLALARPKPPIMACLLTDDGPEPHLPDFMGDVRVFRAHDPTFAARLMALRPKAGPLPPRPFHAAAHLDPLIGQWLEVGPGEGATWQGFMAGVTHAEVTAFGMGPRGALPRKCTLQHALRGIQGDWGGAPFNACAARNVVGADTACFLRVEGEPGAVFVAPYPEDNGEDGPPAAYLEFA